ncbi:M48 family metallopeptidase [Inmirania thermothiophila]|uniref:YgjP-like metallopeptidase domain-containing protein n=1 Tax=Inmirania thermothiophila TaxID=1750597 RepID=A0A3N1Y5S3_9GAMM|nr:YgjP-like metallopeptidase domain-containing protein [Inmirania thermothiophila]ROR34153.1 hypothetical protein EDC57_0048 [Inmirania thermothiophila]
MDVLPPYRIRVSGRARRARLTVDPGGEVEVVLPRGAPARLAAELVRSHRGWIEARRAPARARRAHPRLGLAPRLVALRAAGEAWRVVCDPAAPPGLREEAGARTLRLGGEAARRPARWLQAWLGERARALLPALVAAQAERTGLRPARVTVRAQRTRWGSCSAAGTVSLNRNLLLLPRWLVRYLIVHELAHLRHLDHSDAFWAEVARHEPRWRRAERALRRQVLPLWSLPACGR